MRRLWECREKIYIATKTGADTAEGFWKDLHTTLKNLRTDYIDILSVPQSGVLPEAGGWNRALSRRCWRQKKKG